ncbi:MAG TPA: amidase [Alphaproteobacteria bacterium]
MTAEKSSSARERLEACLARIADPRGEGSRTFLKVYTESARAAADAADARARTGTRLGPLDGAIVSIKDLFDVAGEPTTAGSVVRRNSPPADWDCPVVQRLRAAGAVIVGKTNMTEFAYSGIGLNPHYGTPGNPADRARVPGGSTSGGAVSVADGMAEIAIGSDTGGSVRIPAAFCGIVGFKPTQFRVPREGVFPLSFTLDSIGPMARSVADCAVADAIMAGEMPRAIEPAPLSGLRLGLPKVLIEPQTDAAVGTAFGRALARLAKKEVRLLDTDLEPFLAQMAKANAAVKGGIAAPEAYAYHRGLIEQAGTRYDPRVRMRIERGREVSAADYIEVMRLRATLVAAMDDQLADLDALLMPTVPVVAPRIDDLESDDEFWRTNALVLRNTSVANFFDLCAISLPIPDAGPLPVGLMLVARHGADHRLLRIAATIEAALG